jgi:MATE family multidrug resistance protein
MVARAFGRKDLAELSRVAATGHALAGILGLLTALLVVAFSEPLLRLVGADQKLAGTADPYFRLYAISVAPMTLSAVTSAVFQEHQVSRRPRIALRANRSR